MERKKVIKIGTRGSHLALAQTDQVIAVLKEHYPELHMEKVVLHTQGDRILDKPLVEFGGKGMFITELEEALASGRIDLAVHSAKDMPIELADGLVIAGALPRADVRDVLVMRKGLLAEPVNKKKKMTLPENGQENMWKSVGMNPIIGTGSLRRQFQLKALYPDAQCISIRGNVPTRLQKIRDGICDGVILAAAGLERLGLLEAPDLDYHYFSPEEMVPAAGQGIIAIEGRIDDALLGVVDSISNQNAMLELETERRILQLLEAGCHEAIGVISKVKNRQIEIQIIQEINGEVYRQKGNAVVERRMELAEQLVEMISSLWI